jgi:hypothetical protein
MWICRSAAAGSCALTGRGVVTSGDCAGRYPSLSFRSPGWCVPPRSPDGWARRHARDDISHPCQRADPHRGHRRGRHAQRHPHRRSTRRVRQAVGAPGVRGLRGGYAALLAWLGTGAAGAVGLTRGDGFRDEFAADRVGHPFVQRVGCQRSGPAPPLRRAPDRITPGRCSRWRSAPDGAPWPPPAPPV